jgi:hypothetical protein
MTAFQQFVSLERSQPASNLLIKVIRFYDTRV